MVAHNSDGEKTLPKATRMQIEGKGKMRCNLRKDEEAWEDFQKREVRPIYRSWGGAWGMQLLL